MSVTQLSLWDNEALERGYRCLGDLELIAASQYFNNALQSGLGSAETAQRAINACLYWQPKVKRASELNAPDITRFLEDYMQYPFTRLMTGLKKSLLRYIADCMLLQPGLNWNEMEIAFDLLLDIKDYQNAENFISQLITRNEEKYYLLYFLAQAQWMNSNNSEGTDNYILALMRCPDKLFAERIENKKIQSLFRDHGAMAIVYVWIDGVVPYIPLAANIETINEDHAKAIKSLNLLRKAQTSLENKDMKSCINYRKELKAENPKLYDAYFNRLRYLR